MGFGTKPRRLLILVLFELCSTPLETTLLFSLTTSIWELALGNRKLRELEWHNTLKLKNNVKINNTVLIICSQLLGAPTQTWEGTHTLSLMDWCPCCHAFVWTVNLKNLAQLFNCLLTNNFVRNLPLNVGRHLTCIIDSDILRSVQISTFMLYCIIQRPDRWLCYFRKRLTLSNWTLVFFPHAKWCILSVVT